MTQNLIGNIREKASKVWKKKSPAIIGGNIDYDTFQECGSPCPLEALERLVWILKNCSDSVEIGVWPSAFKNLKQVDRFLDDLSADWNAFLRLPDEIADFLEDYHSEVACDYEALANVRDAHRLLMFYKETYFDQGKSFGYWDLAGKA